MNTRARIPALRALRRPCRAAAAKTFLSATALRSTRLVSTAGMQPKFAPGSDAASLKDALSPLLSSSGGRWSLTVTGEGLERTFKFKTFAKTWDFMTAVSLQCKLKNHHPEWSNVYNTTFIRWTTHSPKGLSEKDLGMATVCDLIAKDFGEVEEQTDSCALRDVADKATTDAGDCCAPKK